MIFLNDVPYTSDETDPIKALETTLAFAVDDWGDSRAKAWVYGIVCGWEEALDEVATRYGWSDEAKTRLNALHARFTSLSREPTP